MKIALTQRSDYFPERDERRDSLDQNWFKLFPRDICIPIPNVLESFKVWTDSQELDFIILTGEMTLTIRINHKMLLLNGTLLKNRF